MNSIITFTAGILVYFAFSHAKSYILPYLQQWYRDKQYNRFKAHLNRFLNEEKS
jgi:hypothetical protein